MKKKTPRLFWETGCFLFELITNYGQWFICAPQL